jgi:formylglycine-generating enzyme
VTRIDLVYLARSVLWSAAVALPFAACAAQPSEPAAAPPTTSTAGPSTPPPPAVTASPGAEAAPIPDGSTPPPAAEAAPSAAAGACPAGMQLVDGDYCTKLENNCLKSWYDKSNKKTVCEEFGPGTRCVGEKIKKRYCIDTFEWPNKKGERPEVMNRFHQAQVKCAAVGKRMCTESEWTLACEGPKMLPFPYGYVRDVNKCHGDMTWDGPDMPKVAKRDPEELARLWRGVRSGQLPCRSDYGVHDLPGNADEVVASETTSNDFRGKFDSVHTGGPWYKGVRNQCRPKIYTHDEGFYYYFLSFRCCAEPDGKPTEPRTPKQIKGGWKFDRVERLAGFTLAQMKDKLELKAQNKCACSANDILCKTMCGTLLGPNAKDAR